MSDFRFQPCPGTIAITTLLEFCSWLDKTNPRGVTENDDFILYLLLNWRCGYYKTSDESDSVTG